MSAETTHVGLVPCIACRCHPRASAQSTFDEASMTTTVAVEAASSAMANPHVATGLHKRLRSKTELWSWDVPQVAVARTAVAVARTRACAAHQFSSMSGG